VAGRVRQDPGAAAPAIAFPGARRHLRAMGTSLRTFAALSLLVGAAACGGNVVVGDKDAGGGGAGGVGTGGSSGTGGAAPAVDCSTSGENYFPSFSKACAVPADCAIGFHQINCCGTQQAIGIAASEQAAFAAAEATCASQYPGCGCAGGPTTAEDGKAADMGNAQIQVACTGGACTTFVP
jgi:hypothetical protein